MMTDPGGLALIALLLPAVSFLILAIVAPFGVAAGQRHSSQSFLLPVRSLPRSVRGAATPRARSHGWSGSGCPPTVSRSRRSASSPMRDSTLMLILVALVAFLVQLYSLEYLHDEPPAALGRYYAYQSLFAFSMMGAGARAQSPAAVHLLGAGRALLVSC